ncbi:SUKH-3 domain-containing protein [Streptomyces sp. OUCMDZ-4982]|uniref:SUKH-3 domain-containing protein n=1 Tax=Streptomyces sp. OUCMDZ-4982 TaxID=2973090 RepID=UPI00215D11BB|nr:SUKH-3 domain-containing protein [Streptomyces sp. OUCMDZ-4982]MCR8944931.1 SUKH-3 domain-containing protein [Streptomyces sp. OUCMDZ-4982]
MPRFSQEVEDVLRRAGWLPGRRIDIAPWKLSATEFVWHAAAESFLQEFGGLRVDISGPGITRAREPFEFDPELAIGEGGKFANLSELFDRKFSPLGEIGQGEFFLAIDEEGIIYLLGDWALKYGTGDFALEKLVTGVAPERLSPPN